MHHFILAVGILGPLRLLALKNGRGILRGLQAPPRLVALRALFRVTRQLPG